MKDMIKHTILGKTILAFGLSLFICSCDESDPKQYGGTQPLATPEVTLQASAYQLSFSWAPVDGAIQYGYKFNDADGKLIEGGLLGKTEISFEELTHSTQYQFMVCAYADIQGQYTTSAEAVLDAKTTFYPALDVTGYYTPSLLSYDWEATLVETRTDGDDHFGTFALQAWYEHDGYDLEFTVNDDGSINILNGTVDEATGWTLVLAGPATIATNQYIRKGVLVDLSRCSFDRAGHELTLFVRSTKSASREGYDVFEWDE